MTRGLLALLIISAGAFPAAADERVQVALVAERGALVAGTTQQIGVTFTLEPEWHIYWLNPGDSGLPTEVEVTSATKGVTVGAPLFPAPTRYEHEGNLVDFIYEGEVTVLDGKTHTLSDYTKAGKIGRLYKAKVTPHMFVIDKSGNVVYEGAIDNDRSARTLGSTNYVDAALAATIAGTSVKDAVARPYGCSVKYGK